MLAYVQAALTVLAGRAPAGDRQARVDLSNAELRQYVLRRASLVGADLSGADLRGANLKQANLAQADLKYSRQAAAHRQRALTSGGGGRTRGQPKSACSHGTPPCGGSPWLCLRRMGEADHASARSLRAAGPEQ
ncbi:pentapeptide repeat-containing protein [Streptomyces lydicus]|uniref:pentapeptide repeat-containing protein n=1 Tax=Streptomyces lydicus TaxID=47763 RepID=UPI00342D9734